MPLVAVAHGSRDPRAAAVAEALLHRVRLARPGLDVRISYLDHVKPSLTTALAPLDRAVVVPLLLTAAYHSKVDIPGALAGIGTRVEVSPTLGPDPLLTAALERRLTEAGAGIGDPGTAVVLVSAGSSDVSANATIRKIARDWARSRPWWAVTTAFASASGPRPADAVTMLRAAGAPRVVVAPYLLAPGHFADKVARETLAAGADLVADGLGPAPELVRIVLNRYDAVAVAAERLEYLRA
ncbi:sirohydrochlorin chelatase [Herbidospora mongoliensis]|uniref:sirohydrochlorin chelatase n=1 Tax=Herbidospora mongoliensis TaxID=688067 RepID=UPI00082CDBCA|nr:sirohydrochlorin chelatase [Herbidospora mongoliensis]